MIGMLACAAQAIRSTRLLTSAIWLGAASAILSLWLYMMGAYTIAVIELSVGAGLVTVLLVFVIGIAGEQTHGAGTLIPRPLSWALVIGSVLLLAALILPIPGPPSVIAQPAFVIGLWQERGLDMLLQCVLIFAGVIGVLGLLSDVQAPTLTPPGKTTRRIEKPMVPEPSPCPLPVNERNTTLPNELSGGPRQEAAKEVHV